MSPSESKCIQVNPTLHTKTNAKQLNQNPIPLNKTNAFFFAFSLETHILNFVCLFLLFCICFTGVFLKNKHFVREWGKIHQKTPQKHPQITLKTNPPILNFECVFLIETMCFMGVFLEKGHSVREWGHFQKNNFKKKFVFFRFWVKNQAPQITPKSRKTTLEPVLKQCKKHKDSKLRFSRFYV